MEKKVINNIKSLSIDMINNGQSGHMGICLSASPIIYTLYANHLNFCKSDGKWINRDRFILSAGHGSAMLYSTLYLAGYPLMIDDLKSFRKIDSITKGHPLLNAEIGVEMTTGMLGEGFASSIGFAIGEEYLSSILGSDIINHFTYVLVSDGDLMEGISYEAASLAGTLKLGKLIVLYDSNNISLDGNTNLTFTENVLKRFEACGWHTEYVPDGENISLIDKAINNSKLITDKPSIIEIKTVLGKDSIFENTNKAHSTILDEDSVKKLKEKLNVPNVPFHVSKDSTIYFRDKIENRTLPIYNKWVNSYNKITDEKKKEILKQLETNEYSIDFKKVKINLNNNQKESLIASNGKFMNLISKLFPLYISLSSDLFSSTKTFLEDGEIFSFSKRNGKNIYVGVREHLMASIMNGLALMNIRCVGSTFLTVSDYMKPGIRFSALMSLPVTYIFTHDNFSSTKDGITHEVVEQLGTLRMIPNMVTFRPADIKEIVGCWDYIINSKKAVNLVLSKEEIPALSETKIENVCKGAYVLNECENKCNAIILSTGRDVSTSIMISKSLIQKNIYTKVVSMPSYELFEMQSKEYQNNVLPAGIKTIVIESSNDPIWHKYVYNEKYIINLKGFGFAGDKEDVIKKQCFDFENLLDKVENLIK